MGWRKILSTTLGALNGSILSGVWGIFAAKNAGNTIGEHVLPGTFTALQATETLGVGVALVGAVEEAEKGHKLAALQQGLAATAGLGAAYGCSVATTHGVQATTVFGEPGVTKVLAPDVFKGVFAVAATNSAVGVADSVAKKDWVGAGVKGVQTACNGVQAWSVGDVIEKGNGGALATVAALVNTGLGFFSALRQAPGSVRAEEQQRLLAANPVNADLEASASVPAQ